MLLSCGGRGFHNLILRWMSFTWYGNHVVEEGQITFVLYYCLWQEVLIYVDQLALYSVINSRTLMPMRRADRQDIHDYEVCNYRTMLVAGHSVWVGKNHWICYEDQNVQNEMLNEAGLLEDLSNVFVAYTVWYMFCILLWLKSSWW